MAVRRGVMGNGDVTVAVELWLNGRGAVLQGREAQVLVFRPVPEVLRHGIGDEGYVER
jgi:hypothetical protein